MAVPSFSLDTAAGIGLKWLESFLGMAKGYRGPLGRGETRSVANRRPARVTASSAVAPMVLPPGRCRQARRGCEQAALPVCLPPVLDPGVLRPLPRARRRRPGKRPAGRGVHQAAPRLPRPRLAPAAGRGILGGGSGCLGETLPSLARAEAVVRLLWVENHAAFVRVAGRQSLAAHDVTVVPSLAEARRLLARGAFDAVLLDYDLDDGKGASLLEEHGGLPARPVVVATSAHDAGNEALLAAGADAACPKGRFPEIDAVLLRALGAKGRA